MPGWPTVGRADEQRLVEALRRADTQAPASLFDAYAERLNDYACSLLADRDGAAEAVHDALVTAHGRADLLHEAGRLRSWLYALVRSRCAARSRGGHSTAPMPVVDGHDDPRERELAALVHEVLGELGSEEREVLELSLRHDLGTGEAGAVLGLTSRQVAARLGRARDHLENAAAAVVLARVGRAHCPDLSAMVDSWEGPLTPMLRRRLSGHIARCEVCTERRDRHVSAVRLLDMVPAVFPPLSLRRRVVETCVNPELDEVRASIVEAGGPFDRTGFPAAAGRRPAGASGARRPARRRRPKRSIPVIVAAVCVLAATGGMIAVTGLDLSRGPAGVAEAAPGSDPATITFEPPSEPAPSDAAPAEETAPPDTSPPPEPTAQETRPGTPVAAPAPGSRRSSSPRPRTTRPPASRPSPARLAVSCPSDISQGAGQIRLTARNAVIEWSATTSGGLTVQPARGRLRAGANGVIWVTFPGLAESGAGRVSFRSNGGGPTCAISWEVPAPTASEPAPDPSEPPSESPSATSSPAPEIS
ncbi:sigma-70 family RNA polymerase sigma factor [Planomonospora sp. ID67723]|uniref:RNA polymerase sigma factor n=1 Tax=Planomonospora sp. ID67723 TaxID=2738134 RepID=UPI0018C3FBD3|nr:sigma-70 family RNA polymerase sigma factor [Planomonospora sp. ID67723]MBG0832527.1 sigma-70 family RNA polymerase sigma factor [Planomonospora sp. ID67723]